MTEIGHKADDGKPCDRHQPANLDALLHLAAIGSRTSGLNHDIASKIQGLMMALDELTELIEPLNNEDITRATQTAHSAVRELNALLGASRALTKPPMRTQIALGELLKKSAQRAGVALRGTVPDVRVEVAVPLVTQALSLAIDLATGTGRTRNVEPTVQVVGSQVEIGLPWAGTHPPNASDELALAAWILERNNGELRCSPQVLLVRIGSDLCLTLPVTLENGSIDRGA